MRQQPERLPMMNGGSVFFDGFPMGFGRIALVGDPLVLWKFLMKLLHMLVAMRFGQDACGGNRHILSVSFNDAVVLDARIFDGEFSIDQQKLRGSI